MKVLITGGTGTLGQAIVASSPEWEVTIFSRDYIKQARMKRKYPLLNYMLGDICDYESIYHASLGKDLVIHAAAQKHIPAGEENILDTLRVNVHGSHNVAMAAIMAGVKQVIAISTDKVCDPSSVYGMTKAMMERLILQYATTFEEITKFTMCRYGNVLGSAGSVLQVWERQADELPYITVTDPSMTRFWLSKREAVQLVMDSISIPAGTILIPKAPACSMGQLAKYLYPDMEIGIIGRRPGEKKNESLLTSEEATRCLDMGDMLLLTEQEIPRDGDDMVTSTIPWAGYTSDDPVKILTAADVWAMIEGDDDAG